MSDLNSNRLSYEDGYKDATERIIKLLEELQDHFRRCSHESGQPRAIEIAIALIKGEK
jgi:hypothetical protein